MKKLFSLVALVIMMLVAVACTTQTSGSPTAQAQRISSQVCPPLQAALKSLAGLSLGDPGKTSIANASPLVASVCSSSATVDSSSLQALAATAIPAITQAVRASSLDDQVKQEIVLGLGVASITIAAMSAPAQ